MTTRNVLVTGACGYLGSRLIRDLAQASVDRIRLLDNMQSGDTRALMDLPDDGEYEFMEGDILDPSVLRIALKDVDTVVHLAAVVHTPFSFEDPNWVEQVNHWGTSHLIEACLSADVDHLVYASTGAVYGTGGPFEEDDPCEPIGAYAQSKRRAERAIQTAADRGLRATILRLGMLFGPAPVTRFDAVANKFARLAGVGKPLTIYGEGTQKRPFLHVRDASAAIERALARPDVSGEEVINLVGDNASIRELADVVRDVEPDVEVRYTDQDIRTHFSYELAGDKAEALGWAPERSLREGLTKLTTRFRGFEPPRLSGEHDIGM